MRQLAIPLLLAVSVLTAPAKSPVERKAAQEAARAPSQDKPAPTQFGEINVAPLKDILPKLYPLYKPYRSDLDLKFSVMTGFSVEADGSLSNIRIITSSSSKIVDSKALEIVRAIGESHVLGLLSDLSSASLRLEVADNITLRITAFAPTPEIAKQKGDLLNQLFFAMRMAKRRSSSDAAELLSLLSVTTDNKRVDLQLSMSRARAAEMMQVPVANEPRHHLKFENEYVRVFDVVVPPGDTTLFHIHANDYLFVSIGNANLKAEMLGGQPGDLIVKDGECRYSKAPITHRVTNVGKDLFRNITIEVLKSPGVAADPRAKEIPGHTLVLDNDRVHVERVVIEPDGSIPMHTHSRSGLGVVVSAAEIQLESPGQSPRTVQFKPGDFQWIDGPQTHSMKNIGKTRFEAVHIEWK